MVYGFRYIQIDENGLVTSACANPVFVDGVEITIDTEGMAVPEMPTDGIYDLYYNETDGLHWEKVADFEEPEPTPEPQLTETEQAILDTAINVDYLVCMKELEI